MTGPKKLASVLAPGWKVMADYLEVRRNLHGVVLMVDSRLGFTPLDLRLLEFITPRISNGAVKLLVLLTKADKLNKREQQESLAAVQQVLGEVTTEASDVGILLFSGPKQVGLGDLAETLYTWMHSPQVDPLVTPPEAA